MEQFLNVLVANPDRTNAIAAVANVIVASAALLVATVSIIVSLRTLRTQKRHNELSVKPLPFIAIADYEDRLWVKLVNNGSGPLIVRSTEVSGPDKITKGVIDQMPPMPRGLAWKSFTSGMENRSLPSTQELFFVDLAGDPSSETYRTYRDQVRTLLSQLRVTVRYTDIYGQKFEPATRTLNWFGRHDSHMKAQKTQ